MGAGAAGLATARQLVRAGLEPIVFEAEPEIGGTWVYTEDVESDPLGRDPDRKRIHTSMYADLRTNLPRDLMAFREFPFDGRGGGTDGGLRFPPHQDVLAYLRRFVEHFQLREHLRLDTTVERVEPLAGDGAPWSDDGQEPAAWRVAHRGPDDDQTDELFAAVAVCNGHYAFPRVPTLPGAGDFKAACLHSHSYRRAEAFAGQRVVLLGARASGIDIAMEVGAHAKEVHLCARGVKASERFFGRKNILLRPPIEHLSAPARAILTNGEDIENVDTLLFCTGYDYRFPFLEAAGTGSPPVEIGDNWIYPLYLDLIAARAGTLAFIGLGNRIVPFPQYELQATLFARSLAGGVSIPNRATRERAAADRATQLRTAGVAERHFLQQGDEQFAYNREIARLADVPPLPDRFEQVYRAVEQARFRDPGDYRDEELPWFDRESERRSRL